MFEKVLKLGAHLHILFKPQSSKLGFIEFTREGKPRTALLLTLEDITEFKEHLNWLEGQLLLKEKLEYDNPVGAEYHDFRDHEDECC